MADIYSTYYILLENPNRESYNTFEKKDIIDYEERWIDR